jgi:hypothetical protein
MKILNVSLQDINLEDERFRFSYHFDLKKLLISIEEIGLINPLVIVKREGAQYVLASGWKRAMACLELTLKVVPAYLLEAKSDYRVFLLSFYENWATRNFNILEKAEILNKLNSLIGDEKKIVKQFFPLLDIPATLSYFDIYLKIARLDPEWKKILFEKKIPLSSALILADLTSEERELILPLVLPLNLNKLKQFLEDLYDLSQKTGESPEILLGSPEILSVSQNDALSSLQKADKIRSLFREKRYPSLSSWKKSFDASLKRTQLAKDVTFDPVSFFEDGEFGVNFSLKDKKAFKERLSKLQDLISDEDLFSIFKGFRDG